MQAFVRIEKRENSLVMTLLPEMRAELLELVDDYKAKDKRLDIVDVLEYQFCNGWTNLQDRIALWGGPAMGDDVVMDDNGDITELGTVYAFMDYAVKDEVEELLAKGVIYWRAHK